MPEPTYDAMVEQLKAAGVLVWHGCTTSDRLLPYPHPMPPGGVDLYRITEDPQLLGMCAERTGDEQPPSPWATTERDEAEARELAEFQAIERLLKEADEMARAEAVVLRERVARLEADANRLAEPPQEGMSEDDVEYVCEALMEVGGWDEIDGDGTNASIIADHIRRLPHVLADRAAEAPQPRVLAGSPTRYQVREAIAAYGSQLDIVPTIDGVTDAVMAAVESAPQPGVLLRTSTYQATYRDWTNTRDLIIEGKSCLLSFTIDCPPDTRVALVVIEDPETRCVCGPRDDNPGDPQPDCPQHGHLTRPVHGDTEATDGR